MPLQPDGPNPIAIIKFGGNDLGLCDLHFKGNNDPNYRRIATFSNDTLNGGRALHKFELDPILLLGSTDARVGDLVGSKIGWVVIFSNLDTNPEIQFSFILDVRQSNTSIIDPVNVNDRSPEVVDVGHSKIFKGTRTITD